MPKSVHNDVLDASHDETALANQQLLCTSAALTDRASALAASLASVAMTPGDGNGDYTIADGDTNGRKVTMTAKSGVSITTSGTAEQVAFIDATRLLRVTTMASQALTSGNTANIGAWKAEIADPT